MSWLFKTIIDVERTKIVAGDHIYSWRLHAIKTYAHHGSASSTSTEHEVTMPSALAFLVANFHSLVTVKLDTGKDNYLLWKTQVLNATRANGFLQYIDGSVVCPPKEVMNLSNNLVTNEAFLKWKLVDNQLLSCLTSSLADSTLPLVLGLEIASEVWLCLEHRFNSMSRSNIHDLKRELFSSNYKNSGNLNTYIDDIKVCAQKLGAVGYIVDDDDMIFHTLNGLPTEYNTLKQTLRAQRDLKFYEVVTILKGEEKTIHQPKEQEGSSSVFVATQKMQDLSFSGVNASSSGQSVASNPFAASNPFLPSTSHNFQIPTPASTPAYSAQGSVIVPQIPGAYFPQSTQGFQMFVPSQMFPQTQMYSGNKGNDNNGNNRFKRGQSFGSKADCQICGKNNHSTKTCYYRNTDTPVFPSPNGQQYFPQNGQQFQSFPSSNGQQFQNFSRNNSVMWRPPQSYASGNQMSNDKGFSQAQPQVHYTVTGPAPSFSGFGVNCDSNNQGFVVPGYGDHGPQGFGQHTAFTAMNSSGFPPMPQVYSASSSMGSSSGVGQGVSTNNQNWYFDTGATNHVTPDATTLTHAQPYSAGSGIYIGKDTVIHFTPPEKRNASTKNFSLGFSGSNSISSPGPLTPGEAPPKTCPKHPRCGSRKSGSGVAICCLDCFLGIGSVHRYKYGVSKIAVWFNRGGTGSTAEADEDSIVVQRANYLFEKGFGKYNLMSNNCEDFAIYCKTGILVLDGKGLGRSGQIASLVARFPMMASWVLPSSKQIKGKVASDVGVRKDVFRVPIEYMEYFHQRVKSTDGNESETSLNNKLNGSEPNLGASSPSSSPKSSYPEEESYTQYALQSPYVEAPQFAGAQHNFNFPMPTALPGAQRHP